MKPEKQRIKIAEACGLFRIMPLRRTTRKGKPDPNGVRLWYCEEHHGGAATYAEVPNYPEDLNAMHEAKQALWKKDWGYRYIFNDHLANIIKGRIVNRNEWDVETLLDATAEQQAEAFLRTLNLWEE
jgi:hypothetical protein